MSQWQNDPIFNLNCKEVSRYCKEVSRSVCEEVARNRNPVHPSGTCTITFYLCFFLNFQNETTRTQLSLDFSDIYLKWGWHTVTYFDAEAIPWYSATSRWTFGEALSRPEAVKTMLSWKGSNSAKVSIHLLIVVDACGDCFDPKCYRNVCLGRSIAKQAFALPRRPQFWSEAEGADWASMLLFVCSSEILLGATAIDTKMEQHLFMFNWFRDHERLLMPFLVMRAVECWSWLWRPDMFAKVHVFHGMKHEARSQIKSQGGWHRAEPHGSQPCCSLWSLLESCQRSAGKSLSELRYSPFKCIEYIVSDSFGAFNVFYWGNRSCTPHRTAPHCATRPEFNPPSSWLRNLEALFCCEKPRGFHLEILRLVHRFTTMGSFEERLAQIVAGKPPGSSWGKQCGKHWREHGYPPVN